MPKRFADTKLFDQSWFLDLSFESKLIWMFLERSCDHAGIWEIDIPQMRRKLGNSNINLVSFIDEVNRDYSKSTGEPVVVNRVLPVHNNTKLWITGFISEQYEKGLNGINTSVPAIKSVVNRLKDEGILQFALKEGFIRIQNSKALTDDTLLLELNSIINDASVEEVHSNEENLSINNLAAKGSEPFERDKDKDKDIVKYGSSCNNLKEKGGVGEKTILQPPETETKTPDPPGDNSLVIELFSTYWGKKTYSPHEEVLTAQLVLDYGFEEVKTAFAEAVNHNRLTLAYIKGILQKRRAKQEIQKSEETKKAELTRLAEKSSEERQQGIKLNLIQSVYGN